MDNVISRERVSHPLFGEIDRVVTEDGKVWYKGIEVALALSSKSPPPFRTLQDVLMVMTDVRSGLGYIVHRPIAYVGHDSIKQLIIKRTSLDLKKRVQECAKQIDLT